MVKNISKNDVINSANELVKKIRDYSRSQKQYWQQVPFLALQADGRNGYSDNYSRAYCTGFWAIESSAINGHYSIFVDLSDGELIKPSSISPISLDDKQIKNYNPKLKPAMDMHVLMLGYSIVDASILIENLKYHAQKPVESYIKKRENWREELQEKLGLTEIYTRK